MGSRWIRLRTDFWYKVLFTSLYLLTETPSFPCHVSALYRNVWGLGLLSQRTISVSPKYVPQNMSIRDRRKMSFNHIFQRQPLLLHFLSGILLKVVDKILLGVDKKKKVWNKLAWPALAYQMWGKLVNVNSRRTLSQTMCNFLPAFTVEVILKAHRNKEPPLACVLGWLE